MFIAMSSWQVHCKSPFGYLYECRLSVKWLPTLRPSQPTWAVSPPIGCHHLHPPSPFIIVTQPEGWHSFYRPTEGRTLSQPRWLAGYIPRWFTCPQMVTNPGINWARRRAAALTETNALPLSQLSHVTTVYICAKCKYMQRRLLPW